MNSAALTFCILSPVSGTADRLDAQGDSISSMANSICRTANSVYPTQNLGETGSGELVSQLPAPVFPSDFLPICVYLGAMPPFPVFGNP